MSKNKLLQKLLWLVGTASVVSLDQLTKIWAVQSLQIFGEREAIPNLLNFVYAENPGIAFSLLIDHGAAGRFGLSLVAILAGIIVLFYLWRVPRESHLLQLALALLLAGIIGNVSDRLRLGYVIDFIDAHFGGRHFPVFNLADAAVCLGAGLLILDVLLSSRHHPKRLNASQN